jgi:hypothetical protein
MAKIFAVLIGILIFQASVQAADKIRIALPGRWALHFPFGAEKRVLERGGH